MKTTNYNPSTLEIDLANALVIMHKELEKHLHGTQIIKADPNINRDNPTIKLTLSDKDGDLHDVVIRIVQLPDKF